MRRSLGYLLAWTAATAVAVGGSWVSLQPLLAAAAERPPSLEAGQLRDMATWRPSPTLIRPTSDTEWREVSEHGALRRTFVLRGGEASFEVERGRVELLSHSANQDYRADVTRKARHSLLVSFTSEGHASRVWVQWRNGPYAEITESA